MSDVAALIADMVRAGVDPDLIGRTAAALSAREPVKVIDEQAERRRASDRERKRKRLRKSADSAETPEVVSPKKETSPTPPKEKTTPSSSEDKSSSITPRAALEIVLDAERAGAVLDHRKRIGKPLTAHAAKLMAGKFAKCHDANAAADTMISNGWQGFEPEWLERRATPQQRSGSPPLETVGSISRKQLLEQRQNDDTDDSSGRVVQIDARRLENSPSGTRTFAVSGNLLGRL